MAQTSGLTTLSPRAMIAVASIREMAMRAQALAHEITIDRVDLQALDKFLMSARSPPDSMMLSELDGFLTGIAIGPELIRPSEWLPLIWGGAAPEFAELDEANAILGSLMARYNEILGEIADDALAPIFWADRNGTVIAMDCAEGFLRAIMLRADAWELLFNSRRDGKLLLPILSLCCDENGDSLLGLPSEAEDRIVAQVAGVDPGLHHRNRHLLAPQGAEANFDVAQSWAAPRTQQRRDQNRPQRSVSLRLRQEVQKVLRRSHLSKSPSVRGLQGQSTWCAADEVVTDRLMHSHRWY
jgi:uncharacterized protein